MKKSAARRFSVVRTLRHVRIRYRLLASFLLLSLDDMDFGTAISAVITCTNNIGPGINSVGPMENFSFLSDFSKAVLSADMLLGRLEIFPILVLLAPSVWRKSF